MKPKILVIDDSSLVVISLSSRLKSSLFEPYIAKTYAEAKKLIAEHEFFIAIVDIELPDCASGEAIKLTVEHKIHTIVLTASESRTTRDMILKLPIVDYMLKIDSVNIKKSIEIAETIYRFDSNNIVIIDNDSMSNEAIKHYFEVLSLNVHVFSNPQEALEFIQAINTLMVVVSLNVLGMSGVEFVQKLQKLKIPSRPIIFGIGSNIEKNQLIGLLKNGAIDYFSKPIFKEEFNVKVFNALDMYYEKEQLSNYLTTIDKYIIVSETDLDGNITYVSDAFCKISGYTKDEIIGQKHNILRSDDMPAEFYKELWETIIENKRFFGEIKNRNKFGDSYWVKIAIEPIFNTNHKKIGYRAIRQDITDKQIIAKMLKTDTLTQIGNRLFLDKSLDKAIKEGKQFGVIIIDVDYFKKVNDTYGHQVGDSVLQETANIIAKVAKTAMAIGRWGGEEFVIIDRVSKDDLIKLAEDIREAIGAFDFSVVGHKTASFGVSYLKEGDSVSSILRRADDGLYRAKESGRNRVVFED